MADKSRFGLFASKFSGKQDSARASGHHRRKSSTAAAQSQQAARWLQLRATVPLTTASERMLGRLVDAIIGKVSLPSNANNGRVIARVNSCLTDLGPSWTPSKPAPINAAFWSNSLPTTSTWSCCAY
jgi:hypothetical protein